MKIGLIGINSLKQEEHFKAIHQSLKKRLQGFFSHSEEVLAISSSYKIKNFISTNELFKHSDAIYFAGKLKPNYDFAINALKNACHLFIEDISTLTIDEVKRLYKVAFEAGKKIQLKFTQSFAPEFLESKNYISDPKYIEIDKKFTKFLRLEDYFTEILNGLYFAHENIQSGVKRMSNFTLPYDSNHFSLVQFQLEYDNGAVVNIKYNCISPIKESTTNIHEKDRIIHIDFEKHFACKHKLIEGEIHRKEFPIPKEIDSENEILTFMESCQDIDMQNISEFPTELKLIKLAHEIKDKLIQSTHPA